MVRVAQPKNNVDEWPKWKPKKKKKNGVEERCRCPLNIVGINNIALLEVIPY